MTRAKQFTQPQHKKAIKGMRAVDAVSRERLRVTVKAHGLAIAARRMHSTEETLGKALDGMPVKEYVAQRLEDYAAEVHA